MKIIVFGASGQTGRKVVELAVAANHEVIAPMRNLDQVSAKAGVTYIVSDVLQPDSLAFISEQQADHIVIALGSKQLKNNTVRSQGTRNIIAALNKADRAGESAPSIWLISAAGVGDSWQQIGWFSQLLSKLFLNSTMQEHAAQEQIVIDSGYPYHVLRAVGLINKSDSSYQLIKQGKLPSMQVTRTDIATAIITMINQGPAENSVDCICAGSQN